MFKIPHKNPDGSVEERYMVVLVGPKSYRLGELHVTRGGVLTVSRRTRDYLVRKTKFFADYSPDIADEIEEILPPQFGLDPLEQFDKSDFDFKNNPPLTQEQAMALANMGAEVDQDGNEVEPGEGGGVNPASLVDPNDGKGDMTSADLKGGKLGTGPGAAAKKTATATAKTGVKVQGTPSQGKPVGNATEIA